MLIITQCIYAQSQVDFWGARKNVSLTKFGVNFIKQIKQ